MPENNTFVEHVPDSDEVEDETAVCDYCPGNHDTDDHEVCAYCGDPFHSTGDHEFAYRCSYCGDEWDDAWDTYRCGECGDTLCGDCHVYCDDCDTVRCNGCTCSCDGSAHPAVHSWDYRPSPWKPKGDYPQAPLLGVELEVGGDYDNIVPIVQNVDPDEDHVYMKEDGSITGVEVVSHPATLEWTNTWEGWSEMLRQFREDRNIYVNDSYGLHVHVSRNAFRRNGKPSPSHAMAWLLFIYRNSGSVQTLARRSGSHWCRFGRMDTEELRAKASHRAYNGNRYVAVNCNNARTYELRVFASTLDTVEFMAALEFVTATVEYTRQLKSNDALKGNGLAWSSFHGWVNKHHADTYPNLVQELTRVVCDSGLISDHAIYPRGMFAHEYQGGNTTTRHFERRTSTLHERLLNHNVAGHSQVNPF